MLFGACNALKTYRSMTISKLQKKGFTSHTIQLKTGKMFYFSGGNGFPLIFIHGFGFDAAETWKNQMMDFVGQYRVFAPDIFWFGKSIPSTKMDTAAQQADALAELMDHHSLAKAHVVGISFGGFIALQFARRHPNKLARLVLVDAAGLHPTKEEEKKAAANFKYAKGDPIRLLIPKNEAELGKFLKGVFYKAPYIPGFVMDDILTTEFWKNKEAKARIIRKMRKGGLVPLKKFKEIKAKTLLIWGRHDRLLLPSMGKRMAKAIPGSKLVFLEKSGHCPMLEEPKKFSKLLTDFLDKRLPSPSSSK